MIKSQINLSDSLMAIVPEDKRITLQTKAISQSNKDYCLWIYQVQPQHQPEFYYLALSCPEQKLQALILNPELTAQEVLQIWGQKQGIKELRFLFPNGSTNYRYAYRNKNKSCKEDNCSQQPVRKGYCLEHWLYYFDIDQTQRTCRVEGCHNKYHAKGFCNHHYRYYYLQKHQKNKCTVEGCDRAHWAKGLCHHHYYDTERIAKYERERELNPDSKRCKIEGCDHAAIAKDLCRRHYSQAKYQKKHQQKEALELTNPQ